MAVLNLTRIPNLCLQSFRDAVNRCFNPALLPNMIGGTYRIDTTALWPGFCQPAQQLGMEHQLEGRYYVMKFDSEEIQQLGSEIWTRLEKVAQELVDFTDAYPGIYAVHENPASPEIHILLSNIALPPCEYHLTEDIHYSYDKLIMSCAAMSILNNVLYNECEE